MNHRKALWLGLLAGLIVAPNSWGQLPGGGGAAAAAAGGGGLPAGGGLGAAAAPAAPPAGPGNLWSFLLPNAQQKANCKNCFCNSAIGQMFTGMIAPMSAMSGGLIQNRCMQNSILNDLKKGAEDPAGAAARIKADEEDAKARRAAVRYLGTVDCAYWPEATMALKTALRGDRNECVRFEAALSLRNGCCCNIQTVEALKVCVMGSDVDGFPPERSDRVRAVAAEALSLCVLPVPEEKVDEKIQKTEYHAPVNPKDYYAKVAQMPREKVLASARVVLANVQNGGKAPAANAANAGNAAPGTAAPAAPAVPPISQRPTSLAGLVGNAFSPGWTSPAPAPGQTAQAVAAGPVAAQPRQPFFSNLTRSLTGRQDNVISDRSEIIIPANNGTTVPGVLTSQPRY